MARANEPNHETLIMLRDRILTTLGFIDEAEDLGPVAEQIGEAVASAYAKSDIRALRLISRDVDSLTSALRPAQREALDAKLRGELGIDTGAERALARQRIASIIRRGTIRSEKERRHLQDHLEMLEATSGSREEIVALRRLLAGS